MTRIIAGTLGGRRIAVPPRGTRPTTDRVREALFSRLDHDDALRGARVIDLFAGSGALGLEALSRGAAHATFVEAASPAARVLQRNARDLGLGAQAALVREKALSYLRRTSDSWDVALLDPPYDIARDDLAAVLAALAPRLAHGAPVVLEWSSRAGDAPWPAEIEPVREKDYGETRLHWAGRR
ncbi:16S rRNA (guanine(966)-N(2))-methyltransferase RsmD [Demequina sp. NBRC 110053]|uniref:16S rRNA (guanine(966)-N(2))-methyltransferase RsmD n=1 Tax=Demequina sp. NBRC 110053 TaxID=1570342 RepID=UPI000A000107|nr:16S rRNA (guanine(966)-N(2))-methyltransferase RsmD [Demequina sp. NBRC 110053]